MKEWMAQADPPKEVDTLKRMDGRSQLLSSKKWHTTLKNGRLRLVF